MPILYAEVAHKSKRGGGKTTTNGERNGGREREARSTDKRMAASPVRQGLGREQAVGSGVHYTDRVTALRLRLAELGPDRVLILIRTSAKMSTGPRPGPHRIPTTHPGLSQFIHMIETMIAEHDPTLVLLGHEPTGVYHDPALRPSQSPVPGPSALCFPSPLPRNREQNRPPYFLIDRERSAGAGGPVGVRAQLVPAWRLAAWPRLTISVHIGGRAANNTARIRTNRTVSATNSLAYNHDITLPLVR